MKALWYFGNSIKSEVEYMGGKTSAKVKNANTKKNYDRLSVFVPKGKKEILMLEARSNGFESLNSYINYCINLEIVSRKNSIVKEEKENR